MADDSTVRSPPQKGVEPDLGPGLSVTPGASVSWVLHPALMGNPSDRATVLLDLAHDLLAGESRDGDQLVTGLGR